MADPTAIPSVVVVGGGLAGMTAALRCADLGAAVTLVEARPRLGGAAFSFRRHGLSVDNGQHVFLRCCAGYRWFLDRVAATGRTHLQTRLDIPVLRPGAPGARLQRLPGVPAPAHLSAALARYGVVSPLDRARAVRGALALKRLDPADPTLDSRTLGDFLHRHGQTPALIEALWGVVGTATLNIEPERASLALAAKVFRTGLLDRADAADVGYASAPLGDLHSGAAGAALRRAGVTVLLSHRVVSAKAGGEVVVRGRAGDVGEISLWPDRLIVAVPPREAFKVVPDLATSPTAARARKLGTSPIVNVHVIYDRRVTDEPFAAAIGSPVQWVFDRTDSSGLREIRPAGGQYLAVTISSADTIIDAPAADVTTQFVDELARLLPGARSAEVVDAFVTRERHATFRQEAGSGALRPTADSGLEGLWLAGSWTATGWPDTMEGAVRSGVTAAEAAIGCPSGEGLGFAS